jgi:Cytochrome P460
VRLGVAERKMKIIFVIMIAGQLALNLTALGQTNSVPPADEALLKFAEQRTNAIRITAKPFKMEWAVMLDCRGPSPLEQRVAEKQRISGGSLTNIHRDKYVHVHVSTNGASCMKTNSAVFPLGAIILKEKFADASGQSTELFTGMVKRELGYNPECGDWEFFTLSADAKKITSRGKLQDCMACHVEYKESDFVTKKYAVYSF